MADIKQWRGLKSLVSDAVVRGASAIEEVHRETARKPFEVLKLIPGIADAAEGVQQIHDAVVATSYEAVRTVTLAVSKAADLAFDALEQDQARQQGQEPTDPEPK